MHTKSYNLVRLCVRWKEHFRQVPSFRCMPWADPLGGQGVPTPLKNHKNIGFPSNTDHHKATKPAFNGGPLSTMAFRWWADGGPFLVAFRSSLTTPSDKMFWIRACMQCVWAGSIEIKLSTDIIHARIQKVLSKGIQLWQRLSLFKVDGGSEDPCPTLSGPSSARQRNAIKGVSLACRRMPNIECWLSSCNFSGDPDLYC